MIRKIIISQQEYNNRRQKLLAKMLSNSAALIFAAPEVTRSADINYPYRQNSNFWYFTGFNEPNALLVMIKKDKNNYQDVLLFNRVRDKNNVIWTSKILGQEDAPARLGVSLALPWDDIGSKLHLLLNGLNVIYYAQGEYEFADKILFSTLDKLRHSVCQQFNVPTTMIDLRHIVHEMRLIKSEEELAVIHRACEITTLAHVRAMQSCRPGMYEYQLEGELQYEFYRHDRCFPSYSAIIGSGKNGCILHYTENVSKMKNGDLVLIDAGCEYQGYATDITRTFPVNGRFSPAQRNIYNLVLAMLNRSLELYGPGRSIQEVNEEVIFIMVTGLIKLGIMKGNVKKLIAAQAYQQFFMHSLSHWLGLDVHDVGIYKFFKKSRPLIPGMVLTIEPGIYIANNANVPDIYHGIGIRIEDNIVITNTGNKNLTSSLVKEADAIESLMNLNAAD